MSMKPFYLILFLLFNSCGLLSESNKPVVYNTESFKEFKLSKAPDYTNLSSWAVHPNGDQSVFEEFNLDDSKLPVDVFFIYPTLLTDKDNTRWNAHKLIQNK